MATEQFHVLHELKLFNAKWGGIKIVLASSGAELPKLTVDEWKFQFLQNLLGEERFEKRQVLEALDEFARRKGTNAQLDHDRVLEAILRKNNLSENDLCVAIKKHLVEEFRIKEELIKGQKSLGRYRDELEKRIADLTEEKKDWIKEQQSLQTQLLGLVDDEKLWAEERLSLEDKLNHQKRIRIIDTERNYQTQRQLDKLDKEIKAMHQSFDDLDRRADNNLEKSLVLEREHDDILIGFDDLSSKLVALSEEKKSWVKERVTLQDKLKAQSKEKELWIEERATLQDKLDAQSNSLENCVEERNQLQKQLSNHHSFVAEYTREKHLLVENNQKLHDQISGNNRDIIGWRDTVEDLKDYLSRFLERVPDGAEQGAIFARSSQNVTNQLHSQVSVNNDDRNALSDSVDKLSIENAALKRKLRELEPVIASMAAVRGRLYAESEKFVLPDTSNKKDLLIIQQGKVVTHGGHGLLDEILLAHGALDNERWTPMYNQLYCAKPGTFSSYHSLLQRALNCGATEKVLPSSSQGGHAAAEKRKELTEEICKIRLAMTTLSHSSEPEKILGRALSAVKKIENLTDEVVLLDRLTRQS